MAYIKGMQADITGLTTAVQNVPSEIERLLERRQMAGPLSLESIVNAVQNEQMLLGWRNCSLMMDNFVLMVAGMHLLVVPIICV